MDKEVNKIDPWFFWKCTFEVKQRKQKIKHTYMVKLRLI